MSIRVNLCEDHVGFNLQAIYPGYLFNIVYYFGKEQCEQIGCTARAFRTAIGLQVPDTTVDFNEDNAARAIVNAPFMFEIFKEARVMLEGPNAKGKLAQYLQSRLCPRRRREGSRLCKKFAGMILEDLGIETTDDLDSASIDRILDYLEVYPYDCRKTTS